MPIPALIVGGFLGAGKTTLVRNLLRQAQAEGVRLAIISNEFGDTGIDRALLEAGEQGYIELDGGCVCCRLSDTLGETIAAILKATQPDRLVLECSGVALPGEVLLTFWRPPVDALIAEEVIVVVADGEVLARDEELDETFVEQLEAGDVVLLNKCDLLSADELARAVTRAGDITGGRPLLQTVQSVVDAALLFPADAGERVDRRDPATQAHEHSHAKYRSSELFFEDGLAESVVLERVLALGALRAKGFVRTSAGLRVVQGVGARIELTTPDVPVRDELVGRVVIIAREP